VLIFPFLNANHRVVYLQARRMAKEPGKWKYVTLSNLKPAIYNLHVLHDIEPGDDLYICEGIPDTITALELNLHAIGVLGSGSFDHEIVELLLPYNLNIFPDKDEGGRFFVKNIRRAFYERGKTIQERIIPEPYKDLNEYFITKNS
jgi:DNA primase